MPWTEQIRRIEERFNQAGIPSGLRSERASRPRVATEWAEVDVALGGGLIPGALHEWFGVAPSGAFGRRQEEGAGRGSWTPPLMPLIHLARRVLHGAAGGWHAVWIGRRCVPYGGVLLGRKDEGRMLDRSLFVLAERPGDRLWAIDLALRCRAVGVVVADGSGFDMAATRRIQLVAQAHETPALLARPPWEIGELSAAQTRWLVRWEPQAQVRRECEKGFSHQRDLDPYQNDEIFAQRAADGHGPPAAQGSLIRCFPSMCDEAKSFHPRWTLELLRCKGHVFSLVANRCHMDPPVANWCHTNWALEWDREQGVVRLSAEVARATGDAGVAASEPRLLQA